MTQTTSAGAVLPGGHEAVHRAVKRNSFLLLIQAVIMIAAGFLALIYPLLTTAAVAIFLGWMLIISGVVQAATLVVTRDVPHFWLQLVSAALYVITGFLFVRNPAAAVATLALLLVVFFMVEGIAKAVFALTVRPLPHWGWVLASGVLGFVIGLYLMFNPALSLLTLGVLVGFLLIAEGVALGAMAWQARKS
jgi:uncharacterized membrane protein HdeD (DUF308 family)